MKIRNTLATLPKATARTVNLPSGRAGVIATLKIMRDYIRTGRKKMPIRLLAMDLVSELQQKDYAGEVSALFYFVRDRIRYVRDIRGVETLQEPERTLEFGQGDCDDKVVLLASLLESIGHETRLKAVGFAPKRYSHVYLETRIGVKWVPLETTEPRPITWKPKRVVNKITVKV